MFASISRGRSRIKEKHICISCLSGILRYPDAIPSCQAPGRASRASPAFVSTTSRNAEFEKSETGSAADSGAQESPKKKLKRSTRRNRPGVRAPTKISTSKEILKELRSSLQEDVSKTGGPISIGGAPNLEDKLTKAKLNAKRGGHETGQRDGDLLETAKTSESAEDAGVKVKASTTISGKAKALQKKRTSKVSVSGTKKMATKKNASNSVTPADRGLVRRLESKVQNVETPARSRARILSSRQHEKLPINKKLIAHIKEMGEKTTREALIRVVQEGKLSQLDTAKVVQILRNKMVVKYLSTNTMPGSKHLQELEEYVTIKDAMQSGPLRRNRPSSMPSQMSRLAVKKAKGSVRTGPITPKRGMAAYEIKTIEAESLKLVPVAVKQPPVPGLSYGLERVLFNPGVYHLQDPRSRVFNFDPYLQTIMPVNEFDFTALKQYITSSRDKALLATAKAEKKKYTGSTSSMTAALAHFHFLLSQWRPVNTGALSQNFPVELNTFTTLQRSPSAIFLRWRDGTYAIDADKQYDNANILSMLGKSMEKLLTLTTEDFEKYRKENSDQISEQARNEAESFHYTTIGDFLLRSQLDAHDPRLPGTGMFDLKTRAVVSIRMDTSGYEQGSGYEIKGRHGEWESFEREYYDMIRAAFLKYSLQVRMGRMDGIFVAFHNTERIFGFQYISLPEMDYALHGTENTTIGDCEFKLSLELLNRVLDRATTKYPEKSLRLHFETRGGNSETPFMYIFAEPVEEERIIEIQESNKEAIEKFEKRVLGMDPEKAEEEQLAAERKDEEQRLEAERQSEEARLEAERMAEEAQKRVEWESLQARVEESMDNDELDPEGTREAVGGDESSGGLSAEEAERRIDELLSSAALNNGSQDENDDDEDNELDEVDEGEEDHDEMQETAVEGDEEDNLEEESEEDELEEREEGEENDENGLEQGGDSDGAEEHEDESLKAIEDNGVDDGASEEVDTEESERQVQAENTELVENNDLVVDDEHETSDVSDRRTDSQAREDIDQLPGTAFIEDGLHEDREVLAMTLTIRNKVNGKYVERPVHMQASDKWTLEYALAEVPSPLRARTLYEAAKNRRKNVLTATDDKERWQSHYIKNLYSLSKKGRAWRKRKDELQASEPLKVLDLRDLKTIKDRETWNEEKSEDEKQDK